MSAEPAEAARLEAAFAAFNAHSAVLEASYRDLEARVASLTGELEATRSARHAEFLEKERLALRHARTLEALPGAVVMLDAAGLIVECNDEAARLLNQPLLGRPWSEIVRRECAQAGSADGELTLADGRSLSLKRRPLGDGEILLLTDVSESRRMRELLARHQRLSAIGEMTSKLAHQIRTPLASALLYASQLAPGGPGGGVGARIVERLRELDRLVRDMLGYAGGARQADDAIDVATLLADVAETCRARAGRAVALSVQLATPGLTICGNRDALKGALGNLVDNALAACGPAGRVELSALCDRDRLCLTVSDDGPGIAPADRERIFEPFFTTRPQGTGLGLAVVRTVAETHGGSVLLDTGPQGSTFALSLPAPAATPGKERCCA